MDKCIQLNEGFMNKNKKIVLRQTIRERNDSFTDEELDKLEKLANKKGKIFNSAKAALKHLDRVCKR